MYAAHEMFLFKFSAHKPPAPTNAGGGDDVDGNADHQVFESAFLVRPDKLGPEAVKSDGKATSPAR